MIWKVQETLSNFWSKVDATPIFDDVVRERHRQLEKWGVQHHPDGTHGAYGKIADRFKETNDRSVLNGTLTWKKILTEEVYEAFAETDQESLRLELIQVMAVAAAWIEDIGSRDV